MADQPQQDQQPQEQPQQQEHFQPQQDNKAPSIEEAIAEYSAILDKPDSASVPDSDNDSGIPPAEQVDEKSEQAEEKQPEPSDSKWAAIRRREQQFTTNKETFAKERQEFLAEKEKHAEELKQLQEWNQLKSRSQHDVETAAKALGFKDLRSLLERVAEQGGKMTPEQHRLYELEKQLDAEKKYREEQTIASKQRAEQEQIQANTAKWHSSIEKFIQESPDFKDSLAGAKDVAPAVFQVMQEHFQQHDEQMPYEDAVKKVNENLETRVQSMLDEITGNKRGLELFNNLASKLNRPAPASKKAQNGITQRISNSTGVKRNSPPRFDEALDEAASWLGSQ